MVKIDIDKDLYGWTPPPGTLDDLGNPVEERTYNQKDMERILVLNQRTRLVANRVMQFLKATDPYSKTIIFCEDIDHAERMRKAIVNAAGALATENHRYVMRITGDSVGGKAELDNFIDPESRYPVIATTSELMSTGVDAKTCRLIVIDKTINSMTTFKQIIGRGTRIHEEMNKYYFTIIDFKKATELFKDPLFDGDPVVIFEPEPDGPIVPPDPPDDGGEGGDNPDRPEEKKYVFNNVPVTIVAERVEYLGPDGKLVTESYRDFSKKQIKEEFTSLDDFLTHWNSAEKKKAIIDLLEENGVIVDNLAEAVGKDFSEFDLICHVAYDQPPLTRKERANNVKKRNYFTKYGDKARKVLEALLDKYADKGVVSIENPKVLQLDPFTEIGTPVEIINGVFGGKEKYEKALKELERELYNSEKTA